jgi:hypothetical protein
MRPTNLSWYSPTPPVCLKVAMERRRPSASAGVNLAASMASRMACS